MTRQLKKGIAGALFLGAQGLVVFVAVYWGGRYIVMRNPEILAPYLARVLNPSLLAKVEERIISDSQGIWTTVPDPLVARIGKPNTDHIYQSAKVHFNNAGMRSRKDFGPKASGTYRIVCLGDSFVFGEGGEEEDRFCDQIGEFFSTEGILVGGRTVETLAVGLPSWTMVQEASYMRSRLTVYDPDILIVLTVANDITPSSGVNGEGQITTTFSPEEHQWGSGTFSNQAGLPLGFLRPTVLTTDLCDSCRASWRKGFASLKVLIEAQDGRGKHILLSVSGEESFEHEYRKAWAAAGIKAPTIVTGFAGERLPHNGHPDRKGHGIFASHYLNAIAKLGWISIPSEKLPKLHPSCNLDFLSQHQIREETREKGRSVTLPEQIHFGELNPASVVALLGGLTKSDSSLPWASIRSGFLLSTKDTSKRMVKIKLILPPVTELYPVSLTVLLNGKKAWASRYGSVSNSGPQEIFVAIPVGVDLSSPVEIILVADKHFETFTDHFMRSVQLESAELVSRFTSR